MLLWLDRKKQSSSFAGSSVCSEYMGLHEIFPPGAGQNRAKLRKDIEQYHIAYAIDFDDTDIDPFIVRRPDGLAFDKEKKNVYSWNTREQ